MAPIQHQLLTYCICYRFMVEYCIRCHTGRKGDFRRDDDAAVGGHDGVVGCWFLPLADRSPINQFGDYSYSAFVPIIAKARPVARIVDK